ncbi:MoaF N-terminal domain-containing protein [Galbibacter sp. EGI 63066]|uniref:MoaF-related domain-containing protein n=1 Tax=Galbibacter sp. EGI 63066 TaxID=2993559 RepID=UPI002248CC4F|nr:MoaF N-terminal domain-containing protein [Galbibacter sp. EGI 63066]MCX2680071.1 MoaF N-terminal domain-containing protein [Galbibacter sp. EGI 63066]
MKNAIFAIMILTTIISCKNETRKVEVTQEEKSIPKKIVSLSGKILEYNYGDYVYKVNFKSENKLHWKCIKGDEKGKEADETYSTQRLNNYTFFISWVEQDGLGVSEVINLKDNTVNCFLKIDKEIIPLIGKIREL